MYKLFSKLFLAASCATLVSAALDQGAYDITPHLVPSGTGRIIDLHVLDPTLTTYSVTVGGTTITATPYPGTGGVSGLPLILQATLPSASTASAGTITLTASATNLATRTFTITVFDPPTFASVFAPNPTMSTAGLVRGVLALTLASSPLPSREVTLKIMCIPTSYSGVAPAQLTMADTGAVTFPYSYDVPNPVIGYNLTTITVSFETKALPVSATSCGRAAVYANYGDSELTAPSSASLWLRISPQAGFSVVTASPIKITSLYPSDLSIRWVQSHNRARISMVSAFQTAVDATVYYENAWIDHPLPDGTEYATQFFEKTIANDGAQLILCTGGEFKPTSQIAALAHSSVNILVMSTLRNVLPSYPNLATATGRMYEGIYYAGFVAASVSTTGKLGFIAALDHPTSYAFVNAYLLGARAAVAAGVAPASVTTIAVQMHIIGEFNLPWNERTAAIDLITQKQCDVIMSVTDNAILIGSEAHKLGVFTIGFNADDRVTLGDKVLISCLYEWVPIYLEFVKRMASGYKFGGTFYDGGLGSGVSLTSMSPQVPLAAQRLVQALMAESSAEDALEEIFCGTLVDSNGVTVLDGSTGTVSANKAPSVIGFQGKKCLAAIDTHTMDWVLQGITNNLEWVPPPIPVDPTWAMSSTLQSGLAVLPAITLVLVAISTVVILIFRKVSVIASSSPVFLLVCNVGAILYAASGLSYFSSMAVTDEYCSSSIWLYGYGFALLFGSVFAKTHRINRLFNNQKLKKLRLTTAYVFQFVFVVLALETIALLVIHFIFPVKAFTTHLTGPLDASTGLTGTGSYFAYCAPSGQFADVVHGATLLSAAHFILLLWGAYLSWRTRSVPESFNEARFLGFSIYNVIVCEIIGFILVPNADQDATNQFISMIIRIGVPPVATLLLLYVPKLYALHRKIQANIEASSSEEDDAENGQHSNNNNKQGAGGKGISGLLSNTNKPLVSGNRTNNNNKNNSNNSGASGSNSNSSKVAPLPLGMGQGGNNSNNNLIPRPEGGIEVTAMESSSTYATNNNNRANDDVVGGGGSTTAMMQQGIMHGIDEVVGNDEPDRTGAIGTVAV